MAVRRLGQPVEEEAVGVEALGALDEVGTVLGHPEVGLDLEGPVLEARQRHDGQGGGRVLGEGDVGRVEGLFEAFSDGGFFGVENQLADFPVTAEALGLGEALGSDVVGVQTDQVHQVLFDHADVLEGRGGLGPRAGVEGV